MSVSLLARQEIRLLTRSGALPALIAVLAFLLPASAAVGAARQMELSSNALRLRAVVEQQWREQPDRHPHRVAHYGFLVFREPPALTFIDPGVSPFVGASLFLEAHRRNFSNFAEASVSPAAARMGDLTPAIAVQVFLPLILLVLASVSVTREREAGTLDLSLSQGVSLRSLAVGKWLGVLAAGGLALAPALVLAALLTGLSGDFASLLSTLPGRVTLYGVLTVIHGAVIVACGAAISVRSRSSRDALVTALAFWVFQAVVLPRALPALATELWPLPSRSAFEAEVERVVRDRGDSHNPNDPKFLAFRSDLLRRYGVESVAELPQNYNGLVMAEGEQHTAEAFAIRTAAVQTVLERHEGLMTLGGVLSPFLALRALSVPVAGADARHTREFDRQAEAFRFELIQKLNRLHAEQVSHAQDRYQGGAEGAAPSRQRIDRRHFQELAAFNFKPPGLSWSLRGSAGAALLNFAWVAASAAFLAFVTREKAGAGTR